METDERLSVVPLPKKNGEKNRRAEERDKEQVSNAKYLTY
jgi:hypothetical protein